MGRKPARVRPVAPVLEALSLAFFQRALIAGVLLGVLCPLIGIFLVQRGLAFLSDGLAHASFGGITLALLLGLGLDQAFWVAGLFTIGVALIIGYLMRSGRLRGDAAVGILFAVAFALGIVFLRLRPPTAPVISVESLLFGSILAVTPAFLHLTMIVTAGVIAVLAVTWGQLAYVTFDPELAALSGIPVARLDYLLLALAAAVLVLAVKLAGVIPASAFVVIPAVTGRLLGQHFAAVLLWAIAIGTIGAILGLLASYAFDVASGAAIVLTLGVMFALVFGSRRA